MPSLFRPAMIIPCLVLAGLSAAGPAVAQPAGQAAPDSEVTSGQRVTGHTSTRKDSAVNTSPEQPAPAVRQKVLPYQHLRTFRNQAREQVAPVPDAPVRPGTNVRPGEDTPHRDTPHR